MATLLEEVVHDLAEEHRALERVLERMDIGQFEVATHAPGWAARDQVAHLAHFDEAATLAIGDPEGFKEYFRKPENAEGAYLARAREMPAADLIERWRRNAALLVDAAGSLDPAARIPWAGPAMSGVSHITARLMETWSHGLDVVDVVGVPRPDTDRLKHVAFLGFRTRTYSYSNRGMQLPDEGVRVVLTAPSGATWEFGVGRDEVRGSAVEFCHVVTRRRHVLDTDLEVRGPLAEEWMGIAQAFAGPPGQGRQPGEFPKPRGAV